MNRIIQIIILITFLIFGCEESIVENEVTPRIDFQEGTIEGVKTDDDTTMVIQKLGKPDWIGLGDLDGFIYNYENKNQPRVAIIMVVFMNKSIGSTSSDFRVISIWIQNSYDGKSKEGIGIGVKRVDVNLLLGNPKTIFEDQDVYEFYLSRTKKNIITFYYNQEQKIKIIIVS